MDEKFKQVIELYKERTRKECYRIDIVDEEPLIEENKIGGKPYLPIGEAYPVDKDGNHLALLLQVNLKDIDLKGYPKKGILEIFTDSKQDWPCQYAVKYFEEGLEYQVDLPEVDTSEYIVESGHKFTLTKDVSYMSVNDYRWVQTVCEIVNEVYQVSLKTYSDLDNFFGSTTWDENLIKSYENPYITIGGHADFTQHDPRGTMEEEKDECLFKLNSDADLDMFCIGDAGILFTLISIADIESAHFENALVDWDCY